MTDNQFPTPTRAPMPGYVWAYQPTTGRWDEIAVSFGDAPRVIINGEAWARVDVIHADQQEIMRINNALLAENERLRVALEPFRSGGDWGKVLAWIVGGAPKREIGIAAAAGGRFPKIKLRPALTSSETERA